MATPIHSKIINKVARSSFKDHGIYRKGQSRTWIDDQYWYSTVIEFQPYTLKRGTFLNIGVNFHWKEQDYFSFDIGYRETGFIEFLNENQFEDEMVSLCKIALKKTIEFRDKLSGISRAEDTIINHVFPSNTIWGNYHRAIISGLNNNLDQTNTYFNLILEQELTHNWQIKLKNNIEELMLEANYIDNFKTKIDTVIKTTRVLKKMKEVELNKVW
jgi:hypothetical protein